MLDDRFNSPQRLRQREDANGPEDRSDGVQASPETKREGPTEPLHLAYGERVLRMCREAGMQYRRDVRALSEPFRDAESIPVVFLHADRQRLDAAQHQEAVLRTGTRAHRILQIADLLGQFGRRDNNRATDHVRVAIDVLGGRMHYGIDSECKRALELRTGDE